jgi:plasmid replication initiation protein
MITLPTSSILLNGDKHYNRIKKAFLSLMHKEVIYSNDKEWEAISLISKAKISKYEHTIRFNPHQEIYKVLLNISKGYRKYELKTAMTFKSIYSIRFYELFSGKHDSITYGIENLKYMFQLENKYKQIRQFITLRSQITVYNNQFIGLHSKNYFYIHNNYTYNHCHTSQHSI